jgi:hypothetical protein
MEADIAACKDHPGCRHCRHEFVLYDSTWPAARRAESCAAAQLLNQVQRSWQSFQTTGTRPAEEERAVRELALRTVSDEVIENRLIRATSRLNGVSDKMVAHAAESAREGPTLTSGDKIVNAVALPDRNQRSI